MTDFDVIHADCLGPDGIPSLGDQSVDVSIFDAPYSKHVHDKQRTGAKLPDARGEKKGEGVTRAGKSSHGRAAELGFDALTPEVRAAAAREVARVTRRWVLSFCDLEGVGGWIDDLVAAGLEHVRVGVWVKQGSCPQFTGDRPAAGAEAIVIAHRPGKKRWNGGGSHALWEVDEETEIPDEFRHIWKEPIVLDRGKREPRLHTTQKPLPLMEKLVAQFSEPGETILDPFAGSGTTGVAARRLGRSFLGFERDERYAAAARARIGNTREQMGLPGMVGS